MDDFKKELQELLRKYPSVKEVHVKHQPEWDIQVNYPPLADPILNNQPSFVGAIPYNHPPVVMSHTSSGTPIINLNPNG